MIFAAIIFALNYCKKNNGIVFIIPKEFNFLGVFYYIRKQCIQQRKKKNLENVYVEEKEEIKYLIKYLIYP